MNVRRFSLVALLIAATALCVFAVEVPYLTGRVTDNAEILSPEARERLTRKLQAHEERSGNQVVVLTVPTLGGAAPEEYALAVFAGWKLGQKGRNNGVLVLIAPRERRMRIEVGYGLEAVLPDILAGRIVRDRMTPRFTAGDYDGGVEDGVEAVIGVLERGELPVEAVGGRPAAPATKGPAMPLVPRILVGLFVFSIIGLFTVVGVITPRMGWFLYFFLIPFWAVFPMIVVGTTGALILVAAYLVGFPLAKILVRRKPWYVKAAADLRAKGRASIGGFTISGGGGGGGGGGGSSWSSSGSSFSGGGGSSGGGGASGSW